MQNRELDQKQIIVISLISILLLAAAIGADIWMKADAQTKQETEQTEPVATPSEATAAASYQYAEISSRLTDIVKDTPYEPGPSVLNLAYYYPDGADTSDVMNSYAGQLYTKLMQREAAYMAAIYNLGDEQPLQMAAQLGLEKNRVLGKYNPTDAAQNPADPESWAINRFKNINIAFYDGDGNRINGYSTVKEILAMASVYTYYHDMMDANAMEAYATALWDRSHSRKISMSGVYYDSGCLNRSIAEEAAEAVAQEQQQAALENALAAGTARSAGDAELAIQEAMATMPFQKNGSSETNQQPSQQPSAQAGSIDGAYVEGGPGDTSAASEGPADAAANATEAVTTGTETAEQQEAAGNVPTGASGQTGTQSQEGQGNAQTETSKSGSAAAAGISETPAPLKAQALELAGYDGTDMTAAAATTIGSTLFVEEQTNGTGEETVSTNGGTASTGGETASSIQPTNSTSEGQMAVSPSESAAVTNVQPNPTETENSAAAEGATLAPAAAEETLSNEMSSDELILCPGHIDLYITVTLKGIDDASGLVQEDVIGRDPANFNDRWQGWTDERLAEVRTLNGADWFQEYGLTISAINIGTPLTQEQISGYMALLPAELSAKRRDIVNFALQSVGKVPYYWGGKPYGPNYERNRFGTLISPDTKGRILRGLDCSGWINWVYWSSTGQELSGESTGTLIGCGRRINREEMQPGDIMVRTGPDAHVVMFLGWAENGSMIVIHETGGVINNVVVSEFSSDWPYYRALAD